MLGECWPEHAAILPVLIQVKESQDDKAVKARTKFSVAQERMLRWCEKEACLSKLSLGQFSE